ncbi:MAG: divergent polysaccharide deacetylase family protein [Gammaproteobacteria bacterium]|nr:divergent polysaccharide deacetylase family protein [Gammaproteobacteria bacterium]
MVGLPINAAPTEDKSFDQLPVIAIIIDDLGQQLDYGLDVARLPGPVACSLLPHTPWAKQIGDAAAQSGKEVMLHLPLQPMETNRLSGIGEISLDNSRDELRLILAADLTTVPHVSGINNHMGSLITRHPGHMDWLMEEIATYENLFFVDSYTSAQSVGLKLAREHGIPATRRQVFLDDVPGTDNLHFEFDRLVQLAKVDGQALAIGHPYPETIGFLQKVIPHLSDYGVRLVSVSQLIVIQAAQADGDLRTIEPSMPVMRNSKRSEGL